MPDKESLYDAFGELLYILSMADGEVQPEEISKLEELVSNHPWGRNIKWSFDYELQKERDLEYIYKKVLDICHNYGPSVEYRYLIELMEQVAYASQGIDPNEQKVIDDFTKDLTERFRKDLSDLAV